MSQSMQKQVRVQVYHETSIRMLIASCAYAGALNQHTQVVTRRYDGTPAYNFLAYYVPAWRVECKEVVRADEVLPQIINRTRAERAVEKEMFKKLADVERNEAMKRTASRSMIGGVVKALPVIWFANDTFNALVEYRDTMQEE